MRVTELGMVIDMMLEQHAKASSPIEVTESGITSVSRNWQLAKAPLPIEVTELSHMAIIKLSLYCVIFSPIHVVPGLGKALIYL